MKRILLSLVLGCLPLAALADGMVIPTVAYPAQVTIPDQRALLCFSNGVERLVIETHFTGAGTNFAWVVPLPSPPVIEEATTGLFPTLQYLFRPEIVHDVPRYYLEILFALGFICVLWRASQSVSNAFVAAVCGLLFLLLAALLLPALAAAKRKGMESSASPQSVSILDRKLVGIFETATIRSRDSRALENWLRDNGFATAPDARPAIDDYVKNGWVFVAAKVQRDQAEADTSTPHPLSFTFKTDQPVYPMRLTGLNGQPLRVDLYVFGRTRASAPHFKVESCTRPNLAYPALRKWTSALPVATKLAAKLTPEQMRQDAQISFSPLMIERKNRLFSHEGAWITALNYGTEFFAAGFILIWLWSRANEVCRRRYGRWLAAVTAISCFVALTTYASLPKIEVKLVRSWPHNQWREDELAVRIALGDFDWRTIAEARAGLQNLINAPTNALVYGLKNWDNAFLGDTLREEDSPGNYLLRETNHQLQLVFFNSDGSEDVSDIKSFPQEH